MKKKLKTQTSILHKQSKEIISYICSLHTFTKHLKRETNLLVQVAHERWFITQNNRKNLLSCGKAWSAIKGSPLKWMFPCIKVNQDNILIQIWSISVLTSANKCPCWLEGKRLVNYQITRLTTFAPRCPPITQKMFYHSSIQTRSIWNVSLKSTR